MKTLKNKDLYATWVIRLPELHIHWTWKKMIQWMSRVRYVWVIGISIILAAVLTNMPDDVWRHFWMRVRSQRILVVLVLIFSAVAVSLIWKTGQRFDVWAFMVFNMRGRRAPWVDWLMLGFTQIGNGVFALGVAAVFFIKSKVFR